MRDIVVGLIGLVMVEEQILYLRLVRDFDDFLYGGVSPAFFRFVFFSGVATVRNEGVAICDKFDQLTSKLRIMPLRILGNSSLSVR